MDGSLYIWYIFLLEIFLKIGRIDNGVVESFRAPSMILIKRAWPAWPYRYLSIYLHLCTSWFLYIFFGRYFIFYLLLSLIGDRRSIFYLHVSTWACWSVLVDLIDLAYKSLFQLLNNVDLLYLVHAALSMSRFYYFDWSLSASRASRCREIVGRQSTYSYIVATGSVWIWQEVDFASIFIYLLSLPYFTLVHGNGTVDIFEIFINLQFIFLSSIFYQSISLIFYLLPAIFCYLSVFARSFSSCTLSIDGMNGIWIDHSTFLYIFLSRTWFCIFCIGHLAARSRSFLMPVEIGLTGTRRTWHGVCRASWLMASAFLWWLSFMSRWKWSFCGRSVWLSSCRYLHRIFASIEFCIFLHVHVWFLYIGIFLP